ncbi:MAG: NAD(P)H-binding protein [Methanomassiliicoccus sp.]|nr:NAD(P)H-binding protein [Methanomassiliicoccus sp.]
MFVVLGASGQIGSMLAGMLLKKGKPVRAVGRDLQKLGEIREQGAEVLAANMLDLKSLKEAFRGGDAAFVFTPENPRCENCIEDIRTMMDNCREALMWAGVTRVVGLSSLGAQNGRGKGNLEASYVLERTFSDLDIEHTIVRPAYYYSNWLGYIGTVRDDGILPTFFPVDLKVPMVAPPDVAGFLSDAMIGHAPRQSVLEIMGPRDYSSNDIAQAFAEAMQRDVLPRQTLPRDWESVLVQAGFSPDAARNLVLMTKAVIDGETKVETAEPIRLPTDFETYLMSKL